VSSSEETH